MSRDSRSRPPLIAVGLVALGQLILVVLGPLTRAGRAFGGTAGPGGIALLSSDSLYYIELSESVPLLAESPVTRILLPLILRLGTMLGAPELLVVVINLAALTLAALALYDLGLRHSGRETAGVLAAAAIAINPLTSQWARFVLTETLTYAAVVGSLWAALRYLEMRSRSPFLLLIGLGVLLTLLRPNGVLLLAGALAAIIHLGGRPQARRGRILLISLVWLAALAMFFVGSREPVAGTERTSQLVIGLLYDGVVVEGTPEVRVSTTMPEPPDRSDGTLTGALEYSVRHPIAIARIGILRIGYETLQLRPHYPDIVNAAMGIAFAAFLLFVAIGARAVGSRPLRTTVLMMTVPQMLLVAATFAVPESRYGWTYLVTWCVWAGVGADRVLRRTGLLERGTIAP